MIRGGDRINVSPRARTKTPFSKQWFATLLREEVVIELLQKATSSISDALE
jgi:hypothetical protein